MNKIFRFCASLIILTLLGTQSQVRPDARIEVPAFTSYMSIPIDFSPSWSPDGGRIVYASRAGEATNLYVVSSAGGTPVSLTHDQYINTQPDWSRDGRRIVFSSNRGGSSQIWSMTADGADFRQLTKVPGFCVEPRWAPDGQQVAFVAYPGPRVMLVGSSGGEVREFARGLWPAWSSDGRRIAYAPASLTGTTSVIAIRTVESGQESKIKSSPAISLGGQVDWSADDQRLLCVALINGSSQVSVLNVAEDKIETTTQVDGSLYNPRWSPDGKRMAFTFTGTGRPAAIQKAAPNGEHRDEITKHRRYTTAQFLRYKSADGLEIPAYLFLPNQPAPEKGPALVWLHGGLGTLYENRFDPQVQYFVDQGFVVLVPNYRSSGGFNQDLARIDASGRKELEDVVAAVEYLRRMPSVDTSHIGVIGFSFGGLITLHAITHTPELFAAAVDLFGPSDLVTWYKDAPASRPALLFGLGGTPEQKPEDYRAASPVNFVERITAALLIVHGDADAEVPVSQAVEMAEALKRAHKDYELIVIPGGDHGFVKKGLADAMQGVARFLSARLRSSRSSE
jgi:dipeptidyl aminopeptidase/acylaminoacyl peptidase